jgi:hypothetical protein
LLPFQVAVNVRQAQLSARALSASPSATKPPWKAFRLLAGS